MIECIPNFSEGRRPEVLHAIGQSITSVAGIALLDQHSDADHNRSVFTFAGEAHVVAEAAYQAVRQAAQLIDMRMQHGQHPRIGAADVVPFVPLAGSTLAECVALAHQLGQRIATELAIPVYFYEAAASRPERRELPYLRRGEYEGLAARIAHDPDRAPDYGPSQLGSAGATIIGARNPLIAFNIFLHTSDLRVAKAIARAVRGSSGGLRGVRALGMLVGGRAQVSMNLTDYRHTPVHRVVELVAREAQAHGTSIAESELVGLIPEDALIDAARALLRLPGLRDEQILERQIRMLL
jgi:glutamate formiminotransferase